MARINIEDSIYTDNDFLKLIVKVGCQYKAMGIWVSGVKLAQKTWIEFESIPQNKWSQDLDPLIECNLAQRKEDGSVYLRGSKEQFAWLNQKSEAGKKSSNNKLKQLADARLKKQQMSERALNVRERALNGSEALSLSLSPDSKESGGGALSEDLTLLTSSPTPPTKISEELGFKPVVNNSAVSNFNARFAPDAHKWDQVLDDYGLKKRLQRHLGAIRNTFDDPQALEDFIETKAKSATAKKILQDHGGDAQKARPSTVEFVMVCIKKEIGVLS